MMPYIYIYYIYIKTIGVTRRLGEAKSLQNHVKPQQQTVDSRYAYDKTLFIYLKISVIEMLNNNTPKILAHPKYAV